MSNKYSKLSIILTSLLIFHLILLENVCNSNKLDLNWTLKCNSFKLNFQIILDKDDDFTVNSELLSNRFYTFWKILKVYIEQLKLG